MACVAFPKEPWLQRSCATVLLDLAQHSPGVKPRLFSRNQSRLTSFTVDAHRL